jgi:hypothetical protein
MHKIPSPAVPTIFLLYSSSEGWKISIRNDEYDIQSTHHRVVLGLLAFMERSFKEMHLLVSQISEEKEFPYDAFLIAGFTHGSPHWVTCALSWLEFLSGGNYAVFQTWLDTIIKNDKKYSQQIRHKAKKISAQLRNRK